MPRDLDSLFAALAGPEGAKLEPDEFRELLGALGVTTASELSASGPEAPGTAPVGVGLPRLDDLLEHMDAEQLKSVAKRFDPAANATRKVEARKAVLGALNQPAKLRAVVQGLGPLEHALLHDLKRRGGFADGFSLVVAAALRGLAPAEVPSGTVYGRTLVPAPGVGFLARALRDGLVLPASAGAPWFTHFFGPGEADPDDSLVFADPRLLEQIDDAPPDPARPLELSPVEATVHAPHPYGVVLELLDTVLLVGEEGGVQLTQNGAVAKPLLNRLKKRRPDGAEGLERALYLGLRAGLFDEPPTPAARVPWPVSGARLRNLQTAPLALGYALVLEAALAADDLLPNEAAEVESHPFGLTPSSAAQRALVECLSLLPDAPSRLADALDILWERALKYLYLPPYFYRRDDTPPVRPAWLTEATLGLHALGLVGVAEIAPEASAEPEPTGPTIQVMKGGRPVRYASPAQRDRAGRYALAPSLGLELYRQARTLQPEAFAAARAGSPLPVESGDAPSQPALLIQPNFDVLVYLGDLTPGAVAALSAAELRRLDAQTASYTVTRSRFYRALELGFGVDELLDLLQTHSRGVPENVAQSLRDWAARRERLRVRPAVRLLEYPDQASRDAAVALLSEKATGAATDTVPVAERFIRVSGLPTLNYRAQHRYTQAPARTLRFAPDGAFRLEGTPDLPTQAVLARFARQDERGAYHLDTDAARSGGLTTAAYDTLAARALGGLPPQLETLLAIYRGTSPAPALSRVSVFSHPNAPALARHPQLAPLLGEALNGSSYLVAAGQEEGLAERLRELGVTVGNTLVGGGVQVADAFETGLPTRKLRERLEAAIAAGRSLELRYHRELENDYGAGRSRGAVRTEKLVPESVYYSGSTPYLGARTLEGDKSRYVRVGYIVGYREL